MKQITAQNVEAFRTFLIDEEKTEATIEKYIRDVLAFGEWSKGQELRKAIVLEYKAYIMKRYKTTSINSMLSSLNSFFSYCGWYELRVKQLKVQKQIFAKQEKEMTKAEYERLLCAARGKKELRLYYLMQTICATGIRVSELRHITAEAVKRGQAIIDCKGKRRVVFLPTRLCKYLREYMKEEGIKSGAVFVSKNKKPLDRSYIWKMLKGLCERAGVSRDKVFPHNFRHLFARTYYRLQKDIVRLADILGHASINTTRIYTMETGEIHRRQIERLGLLRC